MKRDITIGEKYAPAMDITDQEVADAYFEACVQHTMDWGKSREEAENTERENLGYYAGYYGNETRERVERLFGCAHPVFGAISKDVTKERKDDAEAKMVALADWTKLYARHVTLATREARMRSILRSLVDFYTTDGGLYCTACEELVDDCASLDWCSFGPARRLLRELS